MGDANCSNCRFWNSGEDNPIEHETDGFRKCLAVDMDDVPATIMAHDCSGYHAWITTRYDHYCSMHQSG